MHFSKQRPLSFQILCQKCVRGVLRIVVVQIKWKLRNWSHACTAYSGFAKGSIANQTQHIDKCLEILRKTKETYGQTSRSPLKTDKKLNIFEGRRRELRTPAGKTMTNQRKGQKHFRSWKKEETEFERTFTYTHLNIDSNNIFYDSLMAAGARIQT